MRLAEGLRDIVETKGVPEELVIEAVNIAFTQAYQDIFGAQEVEINVNLLENVFQVFIPKKVVKRVQDPRTQVNHKQAATILGVDKIKDDVALIKAPHYPSEDFSAAEIMNISEHILYRLREYEKNSLRYEFIKRRGELVSGTIVKIDDDGNIFVDIHKAIARLPVMEQSPLEHYEQGDIIKAVVHSIQNIEKDHSRNRKFEILLSRKSPNLIRELMKIEVPDIADRNIEIKNIARSVGYKTKILVDATQSGIDPVALCIGPHGIRVTSVIKEIGGEKIDIIRYSEDIKELIRYGLTPAQVERVIITNEEEKQAYAVVSTDQLPYAFGKQKQNVILVSKLCGYRIQVVTDEEIGENNIQGVEVQNLQGMFGTTLSSLGLEQDLITKLHELEIFSIEQLAKIHIQNKYEELESLMEKEIELLKSVIVNNIDINNEEDDDATPLEVLSELSEHHIKTLHENNIFSIEDLVTQLHEDDLASIKNMSENDIQEIKNIILENIEIEE